MPKDSYISPFSSRYASRDMQYLFSEDYKFITWHKLWIALARAEQKLGLPITDAQIAEMEAHAYEVDYDTALKFERELHHDVMAHIHAFAQQCPAAAPIIHLGATSCYVGDNTDIIIMRGAARLIEKKLAAVIKNLAAFADRHKDVACLAYTHLQPAQLTTVGKRAAIWIYELMLDLIELKQRLDSLKLLGSKGTTGTQASFLELFEGDRQKVKQLDELVASETGFTASVPISGQTYSRKVDAGMLAALSGIGQSAGKFSNDMRILQSFEEMEEPFAEKQVGSSAMPYKRNPMKCERITALSRYLICDSLNPAFTAATQWFERSLDDSANKRIAVSEAFLCADAILNLYLEVSGGLVLYPEVVGRRVREKLPFMATENILMRAVKLGASRQEIHERLRGHSHAAAAQVKLEGKPNDLIERIAADPEIPLDISDLQRLLEPSLYTGRAAEQVEEFLAQEVAPLLASYDDLNIQVEPGL